MNRKAGKVFVWPISTRIIHWIIAVSFFASFFTSFTEQYLHYHVAFGWIFGVMLGYRILWGFVGPRYAVFRTFRLRPAELVFYFREKIENRWRKIPAGHNPASSWYTLVVLVLGSAIVLSGLLLYGIQEGKGIFSFLNPACYPVMTILDHIHADISYLLAGWSVIHIIGVSIEQFYHRTGMLMAMVTGYKNTDGDDTDVSVFGRCASYAFIIMSVLAFYYIVSTNDNFFTRSRFAPIEYGKTEPVYLKACGDCHVPYPPYLFPERSWQRLMDGLDDHFNERITEQNISREARLSIRTYLYANSAERSSREAAYKMLRSIGERRPISASKVLYWRETHAGIDPAVYRRKSVLSRANCAACHHGFEQGRLDDVDIRIPE